MHVLLIHQAFVSPEDPGGTRHYELASRWVEAGHGFTIVASDVNYLTGMRIAEPVHRARTEFGVNILRARTLRTLHTNFLLRVASFLSFMTTSFFTGLRVKDVDFVMGTSPPLFQALSAWAVAACKRKPFLLEIRDLWPAFAIDMGVLKSRPLIWLARCLEAFLYARADHLLVNSPAYRDYLLARGIAPSKVSFIPNGVDPEMFAATARTASLRAEYDLADKFIVTYAGAMGMANNLEVLLQAACALREYPDIHILLVGDGKDRPALEAFARARQLTNVTFAGPRPKSSMPALLAESDACLAILRDIPMFRTTYPNKVFDYMAAARPVVLAIDGVIRDVVEAAGAGLAVPPADPQAIADAIRHLHADRALCAQMGAAGRAHILAHFDRRKQADEFADLILQVGTPRAA